MGETTLTLIKNGSKVSIKGSDEPIEGVILATSILGPDNSVEYEIVRWEGRERVVEWLEAFEVEAINPSSIVKTKFFGFTYKQE